MKSDGINNKTDKINCMHCKYFSITWDPKHPRSCKLYGFKSSGMPSDTVYKSSGAPCDGFIKK
ncbi:MAG: uracil-DNA glycosylase [Oscillospiraceae bacterium]|nr:uracil-DNA glycosylase [Oscillospiraceae bacterium]